MENAWINMQEHQIFSVQGVPVLPILDARMSGFDWYMSLKLQEYDGLSIMAWNDL